MRLLNFLRLINATKQISFTNLAVLVCIVRFAVIPSVSLAEALIYLIAFANYVHKRHYEKQKTVTSSSEQEEIKKLKDRVTAMSLKLGFGSKIE